MRCANNPVANAAMNSWFCSGTTKRSIFAVKICGAIVSADESADTTDDASAAPVWAGSSKHPSSEWICGHAPGHAGSSIEPLSPTMNIACPPNRDSTVRANTPGQSSDTARFTRSVRPPGPTTTDASGACPSSWLCAAKLKMVSMFAPSERRTSCSTRPFVSVASGVPKAGEPPLTASVVGNVAESRARTDGVNSAIRIEAGTIASTASTPARTACRTRYAM